MLENKYLFSHSSIGRAHDSGSWLLVGVRILMGEILLGSCSRGLRGQFAKLVCLVIGIVGSNPTLPDIYNF